MTNTEIVSTTYKDGKRISNTIVTIDKSDDLFTLASLQRQYENNIVAQADAKSKGADISNLTKEGARIKASLDEQQAIVDGYNNETKEEIKN